MTEFPLTEKRLTELRTLADLLRMKVLPNEPITDALAIEIVAKARVALPMVIDALQTAYETSADLRREANQHCELRITTRCPSCGNQTLFIGVGGHLTCSWLKCSAPDVGRVVAERNEQLARVLADLVLYQMVLRRREGEPVVDHILRVTDDWFPDEGAPEKALFRVGPVPDAAAHRPAAPRTKPEATRARPCMDRLFAMVTNAAGYRIRRFKLRRDELNALKREAGPLYHPPGAPLRFCGVEVTLRGGHL